MGFSAGRSPFPLGPALQDEPLHHQCSQSLLLSPLRPLPGPRAERWGSVIRWSEQETEKISVCIDPQNSWFLNSNRSKHSESKF